MVAVASSAGDPSAATMVFCWSLSQIKFEPSFWRETLSKFEHSSWREAYLKLNSNPHLITHHSSPTDHAWTMARRRKSRPCHEDSGGGGVVHHQGNDDNAAASPLDLNFNDDVIVGDPSNNDEKNSSLAMPFRDHDTDAAGGALAHAAATNKNDRSSLSLIHI